MQAVLIHTVVVNNDVSAPLINNDGRKDIEPHSVQPYIVSSRYSIAFVLTIIMVIARKILVLFLSKGRILVNLQVIL